MQHIPSEDSNSGIRCTMSTNDGSGMDCDKHIVEINKQTTDLPELCNALSNTDPIILGKSLNRCSTTGSLSLRAFGQKLRRLLPLGGGTEYDSSDHLDVPGRDRRYRKKMNKCQELKLEPLHNSSSSSDCGSYCSEMDMSSTGSYCSRSNNGNVNNIDGYPPSNYTSKQECDNYCLCNITGDTEDIERHVNMQDFNRERKNGGRKNGSRKNSLSSLVGIKRLLRRGSNPMKDSQSRNKSLGLNCGDKQSVLETQTSCNFTLSSSSDEENDNGFDEDGRIEVSCGDDEVEVNFVETNNSLQRRRFNSEGTLEDNVSCQESSGFCEETTLSADNSPSCSVGVAIGTCGELSTFIGVGRKLDTTSRDASNCYLDVEGDTCKKGIYRKSSNACAKRTPSYKAANRNPSRPLTRSKSAVAEQTSVPAHANFLKYSNVVSCSNIL